LNTLLEAVTEVAREAGAVALSYFPHRPRVEIKADGSPVTVADRSAEAAARAWIMRQFPGDGIVGEEHGVHQPDAARRWYVDPIDGTKSYVRGVPLWATLVAVVESDRPLAGALAFPALAEEVTAERGAGCWWNGRRARVSAVDRIEQAAVMITDERFLAPVKGGGRGPDWFAQARERWTSMARMAQIARTWGDAYGYALVATGRAEVMADAIASAWDLAAVQVVIEESGGVFTDWHGAAGFTGGSGLATNVALSGWVRQRLIADALPAGRGGMP